MAESLQTPHTLIFRVREEEQGNSDLNGDGDTEDDVIFAHNVDTGETSNLEIDAWALAGFEWPTIVLWVSEEQRRLDLNDDGDSNDTVLQVHDLTIGQTTNLGYATANHLEIMRGRVAFEVPEQGQGGVDLNGDGETWTTFCTSMTSSSWRRRILASRCRLLVGHLGV